MFWFVSGESLIFMWTERIVGLLRKYRACEVLSA